MAGTAPTDFQFTRTLDAGPVHCSVWLCDGQRADAFPSRTNELHSICAEPQRHAEPHPRPGTRRAERASQNNAKEQVQNPSAGVGKRDYCNPFRDRRRTTRAARNCKYCDVE